ncbi:protein SIEVE ELEMENT OCCLUSION B-like [Argentina anserina]|uniref:protein SIEVE ELEMENT OCCLUSION B-like n=1 Tax=Argentina anserina TaxID=57926 RepID=UPI00217667CA|nr:protein SIEVE ELEMENT OCCLUSION B-like [Potentilla anserina]
MASHPLKPAPKIQNVAGRDKREYSKSDDTALVRQIRETHTPGRSHLVDVKPILHVIDEIFNRSSVGTDGGILLGTHVDSLEDRTSSLSYDVLLQGLSYLIQKIYIEIGRQCLNGADVHVSTMELLRFLSNYSWEAKVVLSLAAFSIYYGEFWLVVQLCTTDPLAKPLAILKQLSDLIEHAASVKPQLEAIDNLIKAITKVTKRIVEYADMVKLQSQYVSEDQPPLMTAMAHIPAAAYWVIRGILACASHISILTGGRYEYVASTTEVWELSSLAHKLNNIDGHLTSELETCRRHIVEKTYDEDYKNLIHLFRSLHLDNMKNLRALISHKDDIQPLVIGRSQVKISLEVLRRKHVLLLITDLSLSYEEILILELIYKDQQNRGDFEYEFVWLPIVDAAVWDEAKKDRFEDLKSKMPWYAVHDPLIIEPPVIKFIRDYWHFDKKMIIVSLDPQGRVYSENAVHMLWIWGNLAFPFSDEKETALWNAESWRLELVTDSIDPEILNWMDQKKYICLFGSDDIEWIRRFTERAKDVAKRAEIPLELVYAGRSTATKEKIRKLNRLIDAEKLSHTWSDYTRTWFFWSRLDSMRCSKAKQHKTIDNDDILREVMSLLSYDGSDQGWVMLWRGSADTVRGNGHLTSTTLDDFETWRLAAAELGFLPELKKQLKLRHQPHHCTRLIIPGFGPDIPDKVVCTECGREMEKFFMFRCCTD